MNVGVIVNVHYYDKVANGSTACTPCTGPRDCPAASPVCSYGYCETQ